MSLVSFTPVVDGATATAASVNTPFSTIYNDYNGNITDANISASAAIAYSKISLPLSLGYAQITANFVSANSSAVLPVTGLSATVTIPTGGRRIKITAFGSTMYSSTASNAKITLSIWDGTVSSGTLVGAGNGFGGGGAGATVALAMAVVTPSAGSKTYNVGIQHGGGAGISTLEAGTGYPAFILVEAI